MRAATAAGRAAGPCATMHWTTPRSATACAVASTTSRPASSVGGEETDGTAAMRRAAWRRVKCARRFASLASRLGLAAPRRNNSYVRRMRMPWFRSPLPSPAWKALAVGAAALPRARAASGARHAPPLHRRTSSASPSANWVMSPLAPSLACNIAANLRRGRAGTGRPRTVPDWLALLHARLSRPPRISTGAQVMQTTRDCAGRHRTLPTRCARQSVTAAFISKMRSVEMDRQRWAGSTALLGVGWRKQGPRMAAPAPRTSAMQGSRWKAGRAVKPGTTRRTARRPHVSLTVTRTLRDCPDRGHIAAKRMGAGGRWTATYRWSAAAPVLSSWMSRTQTRTAAKAATVGASQ